jgi:adenine-specific DNA glycosylase
LGWGSGGKPRASPVASRLSTPTPNPSPQGGGERAQIAWRRVPGMVRHVFTHFPLELVVYAADVPAGARAPKGTRWVALDAVAGEALPSLMRKVIAHGLGLD